MNNERLTPKQFIERIRYSVAGFQDLGFAQLVRLVHKIYPQAVTGFCPVVYHNAISCRFFKPFAGCSLHDSAFLVGGTTVGWYPDWRWQS